MCTQSNVLIFSHHYKNLQPLQFCNCHSYNWSEGNCHAAFNCLPDVFKTLVLIFSTYKTKSPEEKQYCTVNTSINTNKITYVYRMLRMHIYSHNSISNNFSRYTSKNKMHKRFENNLCFSMFLLNFVLPLYTLRKST